MSDKNSMPDLRGVVKSLQPGDDPREVLSAHRERGPKRFSYTYDDIAEATGLKPATVRTYATTGRLDADSLLDVALFIASRQPDDGPPKDEQAELEAKLGIGLSVAGHVEGAPIFTLPEHSLHQDLSQRQIVMGWRAKLVEEGYRKQRWDTENGMVVGWGKA